MRSAAYKIAFSWGKEMFCPWLSKVGTLRNARLQDVSISAKMEVKLWSTMSGNALDLTPCVKGSILEFGIRKMLISSWAHMIFFLCNTSDNTVALSCVCRLSTMTTPPTFGNITCFSLGNTPPQFPTPAFSPCGSGGAYSTFSFPPAGGHNMKFWLIEVIVIVSRIGLWFTVGQLYDSPEIFAKIIEQWEKHVFSIGGC